MHLHTHMQLQQMSNFHFTAFLWLPVNCTPVIASMYFQLFYVEEGKGTNGVETRERKSVPSQDTL